MYQKSQGQEISKRLKLSLIIFQLKHILKNQYIEHQITRESQIGCQFILVRETLNKDFLSFLPSLCQ